MIHSRQALIHIGMEKTGSTYIQDFIFLNRAKLSKLGLFVSPKLGLRNHSRLVLLGMSNIDPHTKIHKWYKLSAESLDSANDSLLRNLQENLIDSKSLLASSEFLSSALTLEHQVRRFENNLHRVFQDIRIFVYVRKQEDLLVSRYSTAVLDGEKRTFQFAVKDLKAPEAINLFSIINRWHKVFGDRLSVIPYVENAPPKDLIIRFLDRIRIKDFSHSDFSWPQSKSNQRLSVNGLEVMRRLNTMLGSVPREMRYKLIDFLSIRTQLDPKFDCDIDTYSSLQTHFQNSNEFVAGYLADEERVTFLESRKLTQTIFDENFVNSLLADALTFLNFDNNIVKE